MFDERELHAWEFEREVFAKGNRVDIATGYIIDGNTGKPIGMIPLDMFAETV